MTRTPGTRERILSTARELFITHTYRAASMRQIAEGVGITKGSLYHHFSSKSEILSSLIDPPIEQLGAAVEAAASHRDDPMVVQRLVLEGCVDALLAHRQTMSLLLRDASIYGEESADAMSRVLMITERATELLSGPDPDWQRRVRATQAFAAATEPISQFGDLDESDLREELLRGAGLLIGLERPRAE